MKNIFICLILFYVCLFSFENAIANQYIAITENIISRIELINKIIKNPKEACMKNWVVLGNPHDEFELIFYVHSISDGTKKAYDKNSIIFDKLVRHSSSESEDEISVVLQYLRLSLMAYNVKDSIDPPIFTFISYSQKNENEVIADCRFSFNNATGKTINKKAEIIFDIGDNPEKDLFLQKICIGEHIVYGWWYDIN